MNKEKSKQVTLGGATVRMPDQYDPMPEEAQPAPAPPEIDFSGQVGLAMSATHLSGQARLAAKLAQVMSEIDHVEKRGRNEFQKYDFVKAADVAHAVRQGLAKRLVIMLTRIVKTRFYEVPARDGVMQAIDLHVRYTFIDGDTGAMLFTEGFGTGTDKGDKAAYKAQTGALKYALRGAFLIPDDADPEADEQTDKQTQGANGNAKPQQVSKEDQVLATEVLKLGYSLKYTKAQMNDLLGRYQGRLKDLVRDLNADAAKRQAAPSPKTNGKPAAQARMREPGEDEAPIEAYEGDPEATRRR